MKHYIDSICIGFVSSLLNVEYAQQIILSIISITVTTFAKYALERQLHKDKLKK